ncbi:Cytochrome c-type biogenesis protein DsbD, protein-disulfide reductase [hydrothermal vent metagenome]|uniref:Cytochrome c-type biogenesis protein DsbD, protein-disulfide reductase n=1 Tax=hydrothermal vent metagenome TaxID=652676 RepID=A0A1W1C3V4_9ZZZZ
MFKILKTIALMSTLLFGSGFSIPSQKSTFLKPEEAFKVSAIKKGDFVETTIRLGDKIHIYDDSIKISIVEPKNIEIKDIKKPSPHTVDGESVYSGTITITIPIKNIESKIDGDYKLAVEFEGCSDAGICYQPQKKIFDITHSGVDREKESKESKNSNEITQETKTSSSNDKSLLNKISSLANEGNTAKIEDILISESSFFVILVFFIFGLLLSMTPCIFPMIPILSSIIVSQSNDGKTSTGRAFFTSLIYVLSMAVTYTVVGLIAGLLGADIQTAMQNPWVLTLFAAMFVALAFSLFGYYEISLPRSIQSKLTKVSDDAQNKGVLGTIIMGLLSALIVGPCVAPPLGGAILFISHTGDALLGGTALFVMSMGMGMPLLLVGIGAGKFMPKPGGWMSKVSQTFGIMMLGLAIFMLARILPDSIVLALWAMLFIGIALYMGLLDGKNPSTISGYLSKTFAILALIYGASLVIGSISGATSMMRPFEKFITYDGTVVNEILDKVKSHKGYSIDRLEKEIEASSKPVVVDFGKDSCTACLELEEITFPDPEVQNELKNFTFIKVDLTDNTDDDKALLAKYELFGTPNIIFFDKDNNYRSESTLTGFIEPKKFAKHLREILSK